jgi:hypothetical protein
VSGKNLKEEAEIIGEEFSTTVGIGKEEGGPTKFVGEIGRNKGFGDVLETREGGELGVGTECGQRAFQRRKAKKTLEAFADRRKNHSGSIAILTCGQGLKEIGVKGFWLGELGLTAEMKITEGAWGSEGKREMLVYRRAESKDVQKSNVS